MSIYEEIKRAREARERQEADTIDFTGSSMSAQEILAFRNNQTYYLNNGSHRACPYTPGGGICSTGKHY